MDIVECHHVDYEANPHGHSVNLVDSAAPNDGLNVITLVDFRLRTQAGKPIGRPEAQWCSGGDHALC